MAEAAFNKVGDQFVAYYDRVRGHVREQLTRRNLSEFVVNESLNVLDVGGGDGRDAVWLASQGHKVKLVDPSSVMLDKASQLVHSSDLSQLVTIQLGDPEELLVGVKDSYDLVLSHGVVMYIDNPQAHLDLLGRVVKPSGTVSVLTKGKAGSLLRLLHKQDTGAALELQKTNHLTNNLEEHVLAVTKESFVPMLRAAGLSLLQSFGVRIATEFDYRPITALPAQELASIIDIEARLGSNEDTKGMGQMLHFICKQEQLGD